nr:hypothetical protein BCU62_25025 [Enterovibrio norvegicus]
MNFKPLCSLLLVLSFGAGAEAYDTYEAQIEYCAGLEEAKPALTIEEIRTLAPSDVPTYLLLLKNIRIQECSNDAEMKALVEELAAAKEISTQALNSRYLSIYISQQLQAFSKEENKRLESIKEQIQGKGLEVDIPALWEQLKQEQ